MGRANQPVFMSGVELDRVAVSENARSADQGYVMKVDYIESSVKNLLDPAAMHKGPSELMRRQAGPAAGPAAKAVNAHALRLLQRRGDTAWLEHMIGVGIMNDIHLVPAIGQRVDQPSYRVCIPTKMVWRVEGRNDREAQSVPLHNVTQPVLQEREVAQ